MRALDTNVVLRSMLGDDPAQAAVAERLFEQPVLIPLTVLLEVAWVLRSRYNFDREDIATILQSLIDRSVVTIEAPAEVAWAIERYRLRGDLPDMLHIVAARAATSFATFDVNIAKAAGPAPPVSIETLA